MMFEKWCSMRGFAFSLLILLICTVSLAQPVEPQHSTLGPTPPPEVLDKTQMDLNFPDAAVTIPGVPGYAWRHGCGPTAVGMVLGYWDANGFPDLFPGEAGTQTSSVNQGIASQGGGSVNATVRRHYEDYALPRDDTTWSIQLDRSSTNPGGTHSSDSVADFMRTSWSIDNMRYGWSWSSGIAPGFENYVNLRNPTYGTNVVQHNFSNATLNFNVLKNEIDNSRPMVFLVDTNSDGYTDHFVTVVGYRDSPQQYACLDTWAPAGTLRWCNFQEMAYGRAWGIWGAWSFSLSGGAPYTQYYRIVYNSPSGAQPQFLPDRIVISDPAATGVLKIIKKPGYSEYPEIPLLFVDGNLSLLLSQANIDQVLITGNLAKCVFKGASTNYLQGPNIGVVNMMNTARSLSSIAVDEFRTAIFSGFVPSMPPSDALSTPPSLPADEMTTGGAWPTGSYNNRVRLIGVSLDYFYAPNQVSTIIMSPKKHAWYDWDGRHLDFSYARIRYVDYFEPDGGNAIAAGFLKRLLVRGGAEVGTLPSPEAISCHLVQSANRVEGKTAVTNIQTARFVGTVFDPATDIVARVVTLDGSLTPDEIDSYSDFLKVTASGGDVGYSGTEILTDGCIPFIRATRGAVVLYSVQTGFDLAFVNPYIGSVRGDYGVSGDFLAGVSDYDVPDYTANINTIFVNRRLDSTAVITGAAWVNNGDVTRLLGDTQARNEGRFIFYEP